MPQRKKKGRSTKTNKKKKKNGNSRSSQPNIMRGNANVCTFQQGSGPKIPSNLIKGKHPNFKEFERVQALQDNYPTLYTRYKTATKRFFTYMMENTPVHVRGEKETVDSLCIAAAWMDDQNHCLKPSIMKDLRLAIRLRSRVAKSLYGGGDAGHNHFLLTLTYCWTVLKRLPVKTTMKTSKEEGQSMNESEAESFNRFSPLKLDENDEEEEDEEIFPSSPIPRPQPVPEPMTLDELMSADYRTDAYLFLINMDEIMGFIVEQYKAVVVNCIQNKRKDMSQSALGEMFLEAAVASNMAIAKVQQMEMELQVQHVHLNTPYRLLATMILPEFTRKITTTLREHASKLCNEETVIRFLGDCIECYFRNESDKKNRKSIIIQEFCTEFLVDERGMKELQDIFKCLERLTILEVPLGKEKIMNSGFVDLMETHMAQMDINVYRGTSSLQSHHWLEQYKFIGGDRSIHHTIRLLQAFGSIIRNTPEDEKIVAKPGFFGQSPWRPGRSRKIHGDLDEVLMADILPQWVIMCRKGILGCQKLPRENEICPLFVLLRAYVENPDNPVTWSTAFAVHAMLTAILETDQIFDEIINISKDLFGHYFDQVDHALKMSKSEEDFHMNQNTAQNLFTVAFLKNLGNDAFGDRAIWNPLCGGTTLSYICYFGNLEAGCTLVDCRSQLRVTLHLYHALLVNGIIRKGQILILDILYEAFKSCRAVWEGPLPKKGDFVQRFWVCFGVNAQDARKMAQMTKEEIQKHEQGYDGSPFDNLDEYFFDALKARSMKSIEPAEISKSYRRICDRDFHDVEDNYHTHEQRRRNKDSEFYDVAVRTNDTLDAIDQEQSILSKNLVSCGAYLEQFVCSLSRVLQFDPILSAGVASVHFNDKRPGFNFLFARFVLGALDFNPSSYSFLDAPTATVSAAFLTGFFNKVPPHLICWFQEVVAAEH